jgi:hypothetical protein
MTQNDIKKRIEEINKEVGKLNKEKEKLLSKVKHIDIIDAIDSLSKMNWKRQMYLKHPFKNKFLNTFKKECNLGKSVIIDDYENLSMYYERHEDCSIFEIAECIDNEVGGDHEQEIKILYDRLSKKSYKVKAKDALKALYDWAVENKIHTWKVDW